MGLKLRHGPKIIPGTIRAAGDDGADRLDVTMTETDRGVAPGQFAVFYDGEVCLGGAKIA